MNKTEIMLITAVDSLGNNGIDYSYDNNIITLLDSDYIKNQLNKIIVLCCEGYQYFLTSNEYFNNDDYAYGMFFGTIEELVSYITDNDKNI